MVNGHDMRSYNTQAEASAIDIAQRPLMFARHHLETRRRKNHFDLNTVVEKE